MKKPKEKTMKKPKVVLGTCLLDKVPHKKRAKEEYSPFHCTYWKPVRNGENNEEI